MMGDDGVESTRIADRAILITVSRVISHMCYLLILVILARSLSRTDFGTFNQVWLVQKSLIYLFGLGLPVSAYYFLPRLAEGKRKTFVLQTIISLSCLAIPFSVSMYLLADTLSIHFGNPELAYYMRLFSIYPLATLPTVSTDAILLSLGRAKSAAIFEICTKVAMIVSVAGATIVDPRLDLIFGALIVYSIIQCMLGVWMMWQPVRKERFHFSLADWKSQISFAAPYGFATLAGVFNYQVDKVLIALVYPPAVFALYAVGAFEIPLAGITSVPVVSVILPELTRKFTSGDIPGFMKLWHGSMVKLAVPIFGVTAFLMVFAETMVTGLFSSQYAESVPLFRIYLLFLPLRITVLDNVLASLGETNLVFKVHLAALFLNIFLGFMLIWATGWLGPAIAAVFGGYFITVSLLIGIRGRLAVSLGRLIPWKELFRIGLLAMLAAIATLPVSVLEIGLFSKIITGFLIYTVIYLIGSFRANAITTADVDTFRRWISFALPWPAQRQR